MIQSLLSSEIKNETDVTLARKKAREIAAELKFGLQEQTRIATAVSELARNAYQYAKGGMVEFKVVKEGEKIKYVIVIKDKGPGIAALDQILDGSYVSPEGMGLGVAGAKKLMDEFLIETSAGTGTAITIKKIIPFRSQLLSATELKQIVSKIMALSSGDPVSELLKQNQEILLTVSELNDKKVELEGLNQELEDTNRGVVALYAELDEKAEFLQLANDTKTSFLSDLTHEFRSPLNSILSISQILLSEARAEKASEREKQVNFIIKASSGLSDLVNDLLDIAKIEAGKIKVRTSTFSVDEIFSSLRGLMKPQAGSGIHTELHFDAHHEILLHTDEAKVTQVLRNLISNALKFTPEGEVTVSVSKLPEERVCFSVKDSGIGIKQEDLKLIFDEFYQVENELQSQAKGTGLGLPLCKKLSKLLGGELTVESVVGFGSTFTVTIPLKYSGDHEATYQIEPQKLAVFKQPLRGPVAQRKKLLIIDDDESIRYGIIKSLQGLDIEIREAQDGEEGFTLAQSFFPNLIIVDLVMPNKNGFEFIKESMSKSVTRNIPIILHTSQDLEPIERQYLEQVTHAVVSKNPEDPSLLRDTVKTFLELP
ncbi:MAG TPA: ATP-binding protein [Bacteriovoracaceae bacterium]|nr:ATP-binding protein [Bacteriovoracaceae bacterium]